MALSDELRGKQKCALIQTFLGRLKGGLWGGDDGRAMHTIWSAGEQ